MLSSQAKKARLYGLDITCKSPLRSIYNTNHAKQEVKGYSMLDTIWIIVGFILAQNIERMVFMAWFCFIKKTTYK